MDDNQPLLKKYIDEAVQRSIDFLFNNLLRLSTFLAAYGIIGHVIWPQHRDVIDASIATVMAAKKG